MAGQVIPPRGKPAEHKPAFSVRDRVARAWLEPGVVRCRERKVRHDELVSAERRPPLGLREAVLRELATRTAEGL